MKSIFATLVLLVATTSYAADVYKIDTKESSISWKGFKKAGSTHNGGISVKEGEVQADKKGQITGGNISFDMATITNEDLKGSPEFHKKLLTHLSNEDFFNITKYPTTNFKILNVTSKSKDEVLVKGELTMIGQTKPLEFPAKVTVANGVVKGEATVKVDRTKWGLKYGSGNIFKELTADKIISDEFELNLKLVAKK